MGEGKGWKEREGLRGKSKDIEGRDGEKHDGREVRRSWKGRKGKRRGGREKKRN